MGKKRREAVQQNLRSCFRTWVPDLMAAWVEIGLTTGRVRLPLREISVESDGHTGTLRLGDPGPAVRRLSVLAVEAEVPLHIDLPGEPVVPADGSLLRWERPLGEPVLRYRLRDRRGDERIRRFWAACQRYYLTIV